MKVTEIIVRRDQGNWTVDVVGSGLRPLPWYDRDEAVEYAQQVAKRFSVNWYLA